MAQQTTQFPPGGSLLNWAPGFSTSGSPVRGIKIDNTSGSWLNLQIPSLPVQYIPPYTLAWSMTLLTPLSNVSIYSEGPPGSTSTNTGSNVSVYAYDQSVGDSNGNTYYTPVTYSTLLIATDSLAIPALGTDSVPGFLPSLTGKSYRLHSFEADIGNYATYKGFCNIWLNLLIGGPCLITLNPVNTGQTILLEGFITPPGEGLDLEGQNFSSTTQADVIGRLIYSVM